MVSRVLIVKYTQITLVVALYWTVSITSVFVNKTLLSNKDLDVPFFVLWYQCFISVLICAVIRTFSAFYPGRFHFPSRSPLDKETLYNVFPLSAILASMIVFNALCLKYVDISFYYIGRSLTTIFNVILSFVVLRERVLKKPIACCGVIVFGFLLGVDQENVSGTFSFLGTLSGLLASLSVALYSVYMKKVLPFLDKSILLMSYINNVYMCVILLPILILNGELSKLMEYENILDSYFWIMMTIGGVFGFSMGYVTSLQVKVTSPLTHNISGTAKACVQTLIATYWYEETKTVLWWISNYVILLGSFAYARVKQLEMAKS